MGEGGYTDPHGAVEHSSDKQDTNDVIDRDQSKGPVYVGHTGHVLARIERSSPSTSNNGGGWSSRLR